jgi:hypothetical protein
MSGVFNHSVRREWLDVNPIRMVRQSAKRTRMPIVLSIEQIAALTSHPEGTHAHDGIPRRVYGPSGWGVARPQVEGHRFSEDGDPYHSLEFKNERVLDGLFWCHQIFVL